MSGLSLATLGRPGEAATETSGLSLGDVGDGPGEAAIEMPWPEPGDAGTGPGEAATETSGLSLATLGWPR